MRNSSSTEHVCTWDIVWSYSWKNALQNVGLAWQTVTDTIHSTPTGKNPVWRGGEDVFIPQYVHTLSMTRSDKVPPPMNSMQAQSSNEENPTREESQCIRMGKVRNKIHTSRTKYVHREKGKRENHKKWSNTVHISGKSLDNIEQDKVQKIEFFTEAMQAVELCLHSLYVVIIADSICSYCTSSAATVRHLQLLYVICSYRTSSAATVRHLQLLYVTGSYL